MGRDIEMLVVGNCMLDRAAQDRGLAQDDKGRFELD
jgi:hypothetical protein